MHTQITSRSSIMPARRLLLALYLVSAIVACSLMPFASPTAWAELQSDTQVWGDVRHEEISGTPVLTSNDGSGGWKVRLDIEIVVTRNSH